MINKGAHHMHEQLCSSLVDYLGSQYLGRSEILFDACQEQMRKPGNLFSEPYIESSPAYATVEDGIAKSKVLPEHIRRFFCRLSEYELGVYRTPFRHQIEALEHAWMGRDLFVSTGTGSGKTECFMWPLIAKVAREALENQAWNHQRGIRTIVMYPMNALVADQVSRLRRLLGDPQGRFLDAFQELVGKECRRPQFGMYTGRTPYAGPQPIHTQDLSFANSLEAYLSQEGKEEYYQQLMESGRIPAKHDLATFIKNVREGNHRTDPLDAEMISRFEIQNTCPDILITNYSMLEYMLLRPREDKIWENTKVYLESNPHEKLLFIIDEAHMYHGSSGGEVALLLQRLMARLGIDRSRMQFILTTASMPHSSEEDKAAVYRFAGALTSTDNPLSFEYLWGYPAELKADGKCGISAGVLASVNLNRIDESEVGRLQELNLLREKIAPATERWQTMTEASQWLYNHLLDYEPFMKLFQTCRGTAISIFQLAEEIFPASKDATAAVDAMLAIAPLGKDISGSVLFPARMHMLFRGFHGVYACCNPNCTHGVEGGGMKLGAVFLRDHHSACPYCGSAVFELHTDRRCGALYLHGYVSEPNGKQYLWMYPGTFFDDAQLKEMHFYLPMEGDKLPPAKRGGVQYARCFLEYQSGYICFDDSGIDKPEQYRELWYSKKEKKGQPDLLTFGTCPKCRQQYSHAQISSFNTRGNQPFYNVIQTQFQEQPPASAKKAEDERLPNDGRKVLLFSDGRQKAAVLARDMSVASDEMAVRKLFMIALQHMADEEENSGEDLTLNDIYGYMVEEANKQHLDLFSNNDRAAFKKDQVDLANKKAAAIRRGRCSFKPHSVLKMVDAPSEMLQHLLRLFCMNYNTLVDTGLCILEPAWVDMDSAILQLRDKGIVVEEDEFKEVFSALSRNMLTDYMALGHTILEDWRTNVRRKYGNEDFGINDFDQMPQVIATTLGIQDNLSMQRAWMDVMKSFMQAGQENNRRYFFRMHALHPVNDPEHTWYRCRRCSAVSPYRLKGRCQVCGSEDVFEIKDGFAAEHFWRAGILRAMNGETIRVIDTEEHTAQLGHKDQRRDIFAQTEKYEMRFQDILKDGEKPVDILSSTTTMEVGIDIGSLVAVGMRNMPPMRENYQQRAGRAGRRGSSLSTIMTYAEGGPHDAYYFENPVPMFRGDPRKPWLDATSQKLLYRHLKLIILNETARRYGSSLDGMSAVAFVEQLDTMLSLIRGFEAVDVGLSKAQSAYIPDCKCILRRELLSFAEKVRSHPDVYGTALEERRRKSMLDALYEEGIIPTYSFPKDVVSTYIEDEKGNIVQQVERGLDIAISEYAPGRSIVVNKETYVIGGIYCHTDNPRYGRQVSDYVNDPNYVKRIVHCDNCDWFGFPDDTENGACPFCHSPSVTELPEMLRPWGFSPLNGRPVAAAMVEETYSSTGLPTYSTLPKEEDMLPVQGYVNINFAARQNQRIILMNQGRQDKGFMICCECGAAAPGDDPKVLFGMKRPGNNRPFPCNHNKTKHINLGYDFITDMLVLTFALPKADINLSSLDGRAWLRRACTTMAEAFRKASTTMLDIEFNEIQAGYRLRHSEGIVYADVYLYDSLSSGAGYCAQAGERVEELLENAKMLLVDCDCDSACQQCLKHYQNQRIQMHLDRHAALKLLFYGQTGLIPDMLSVSDQWKAIRPMREILEGHGVTVNRKSTGEIELVSQSKRKKLIVDHAMRHADFGVQNGAFVVVSQEALQNAKPYAIKRIVESMHL